MKSSTSDAADMRDRHSSSRVPDDVVRGADSRLYWDWYQRLGPGAEILGDVAGRIVADLGAGTGRHAAHVAHVLGAAHVAAIDRSQTQITRGRELFGHVPELDFVHGDAATYLTAAAGSIDVAYSYFGAADFTDPRRLLPAVAAGLRPGGTLIVATLADHKGGQAPESDVRPADVSVRAADGTLATVRRWVLDTPVWEKLLTAAGFTDLVTDVLRDPGTDQQPPIATNLIRATRRSPDA